MIDALRRYSLFALYQITVALGIVLLPVAILFRQVGLRLPFGNLVAALGDAYDQAQAN